MDEKKNNYIDGKVLKRELTILADTFKEDVKRIMKEKKLALKSAEKLAKGHITDELGEMFLKIAYNLSNKNNFNNYTYKEEMIGLGIEYMCRFSKRFDATKTNCNAFSYCTQICFNGFIQAIKKEKAKSELKDKMIKQAMEKTELERWNQEHKSYLYEDDD